jgi:predicted CXXCH cytochrome family protein
MKKLLVIVVVLAVALVGATAAMALTIVNSKHDLSSSSSAAVKSSDQTELCIFCHTPHTAASAVVPLWNRNASTTTFTPYYNSSTINYTPGAPGAISLACLSCHDGAVDEALVNPNGIGTNPPTMGTGAWTVGNLIDGAFGLSNDHPVGSAVNMAAINALDAGIYNAPQNANVRLFSGAVECASCHKVHDNANPPFLAMSNAASAMCLTCHNK